MGHAYLSIGEEPLLIMCVCSTPDMHLAIGTAEHHGVAANAEAHGHAPAQPVKRRAR